MLTIWQIVKFSTIFVQNFFRNEFSNTLLWSFYGRKGYRGKQTRHFDGFGEQTRKPKEVNTQKAKPVIIIDEESSKISKDEPK